MAEREFPPNTKSAGKPKQTTSTAPDKNIQPVVQKPATVGKPTMGKRVKNIFIRGELKSSVLYITNEVLLPTMRDMLFDAFTQGVERTVYGDNQNRIRSRPISRPGAGPRSNYATPVQRTSRQPQTVMFPDQPPRHYHSNPRQSGHADIILDNRQDAMAVIDNMQMIVEQYQVVSVADLYELVGLPAQFTDNKWGWYTLGAVNIQQTRNGWRLDLPPVEPISQ